MSRELPTAGVSRRALLRLAAAGLAAPALALWGSRLRLLAATLPPRPAAPQPEGAADIPASVLLDPSQLADILSHPGDKPTIICVGFKFLYDGGHIPGALYRGPAQQGAGIVSLATWAGNQKPDKERSIERIDPIVALIMAVGRSMVEEESPYADGRGLLTI